MSNEKKIKKHIITGEKVFNFFNVLFLSLFSLSCIIPLVNLFAKAVSSETAVVKGEVFLLPKNFQLESLAYMALQPAFQRAFFNSVYITLTGTVLHIIVTTLAAYSLSRKILRGKKILQFIIIFTMMFSGGTIPTFILMHHLNLL
jgi:putative aldouronate transport system permease protein